MNPALNFVVAVEFEEDQENFLVEFDRVPCFSALDLLVLGDEGRTYAVTLDGLWNANPFVLLADDTLERLD